MTLSEYAIQKIRPYVFGDLNSYTRTGRELIKLFNKYGARDIYDEYGLPDIDKKNGHRPSRKEYAEKRLKELSGKEELRELLSEIFNEFPNKEETIIGINGIIQPENFTATVLDGNIILQGGVIDKMPPIKNEAHFQNIQKQILQALNSARVSIRVVMAWFTNKTLFEKLIEKSNQGIDVQIAIFDDGINKKHGIDIEQLPNYRIKRGKRGGLMHDKFCIIDNQIVITGSYNWSDNAEFRNDENITVEKDPNQASSYSEEFRRLTK
jgi:phosphatidylserine/phosphatidylglycerophosphate/cardiolipin synthase-like enzyme